MKPLAYDPSARSGKLSVIGLFRGPDDLRWKYLVACDCGTIKDVSKSNFPKTYSCGCDKSNRCRMPRSHGFTVGGRTPRQYWIWAAMIQRCENPNNRAFHHYGERGITVCDRWHKYENFLEDMGAKPEGMTLERIKNEEGYSKDNCRWATWIEQNNNRRKRRWWKKPQ